MEVLYPGRMVAPAVPRAKLAPTAFPKPIRQYPVPTADANAVRSKILCLSASNSGSFPFTLDGLVVEASVVLAIALPRRPPPGPRRVRVRLFLSPSPTTVVFLLPPQAVAICAKSTRSPVRGGETKLRFRIQLVPNLHRGGDGKLGSEGGTGAGLEHPRSSDPSNDEPTSLRFYRYKRPDRDSDPGQEVKGTADGRAGGGPTKDPNASNQGFKRCSRWGR
eukprot:scaffold155_cov347-Pavlova_lutheri.AAC.104